MQPRGVVLALMFAAALAACAGIRPQSKSTNGQIVSVTLFAKTDLSVTAGPSVPIGTMMVPIPSVWLPKETFIYDVKLKRGVIVRTQSQRQFAVGACITLWHEASLDSISGEYNFIQGTLEQSGTCE